jgi:phosphoglucosamine mutase
VSRLFGTDGVRGVANRDLTPELAFKIGRAAAAVLEHKADMLRPVVIGRDTRVSGTMLEAAIVAGITSTGRNVVLVGIVPTPGVARITTAIEAAAGIMISASHNPIEDNGIKIFGGDGFKLTDAEEDEITRLLDSDALPRPTHLGVGIATTSRGLVDRYVFSLLEAGADLSGFTIVVDAAFGAAFEIGPYVFRRLGAEVVALGAENDGSRINVDCGATHLDPLRSAVEAQRLARPGARVIGVAFDGDADRALFVDETGQMLSGDHVMLVLAREMHRSGALPGPTVVGTLMSNVGLEQALARDGIRLERTPVGDRYVLERMRANGYRLGGEQSGHVIDLLRNTTGDGPLTAVSLLAAVVRSGGTLHELAADLVTYPQVLLNVRIAGDKDGITQRPTVVQAVERAARELGDRGRIVVRPSGTEPLVRIMLEGPDRTQIDRLASDVARAIQAAALA